MQGVVEFLGDGIIGCGGLYEHHSQKRNNAGEVGRKGDSTGLSQQVLGLTAGV